MDEATYRAAGPVPAKIGAWEGYYINLDRSPDRRARVEQQLRDLGLSDRYQRLPAVDGRTLSRRAPVKPGEAGIYESHLLLLEKIAASDRPAHVMEDDALLSDLTAPVVDEAIGRGVLDEYDIVFTETYTGESISGIRAFRSAYQEATASGPIVSPDQVKVLDLATAYLAGATSYVISPRGARKLAPVLRQEWERGPNGELDLVMRHFIRKGEWRAGCFFPFVTTMDMESAWLSFADRNDNRDRAMLQRLVRYSFFVQRDMAGHAIPLLDRTLSRLPPVVADEASDLYARVVAYWVNEPAEPGKA
jgi:GR25 family glycosyltransferase involved in LPS biosynthesis